MTAVTDISAAPTVKILMLLSSEFVVARYNALRERSPSLEIVTELVPGANPGIQALFAFKLPEGVASRLPDLRLAASVGAGADGILAARDLDPNVRVTRASDAGLAFGMAQFVVMQILRTFGSLPLLESQHRAAKWKRIAVPDASAVAVGIMGLGALGSVVANAVASLGFNVIGWKRSAPDTDSVRTFVGHEGLGEFLASSNFLVCLLPLTDETRNLVDKTKLRL